MREIMGRKREGERGRWIGGRSLLAGDVEA
jgi:hypothetical protein